MAVSAKKSDDYGNPDERRVRPENWHGPCICPLEVNLGSVRLGLARNLKVA